MSVRLNKWTLGQLRIALDKMGQDTQGTKSVLIERLEACLNEEVSPSRAPHEDIQETKVPPSFDKNIDKNIQAVNNQNSDNVEPADAVGNDYDNHSCVSAVSSVMFERAKLAGLQARAAYLKQKHELDRQAHNIQAMQESLDLEMKIREVSAREAVFKIEGTGDRDALQRSTGSLAEGAYCLDDRRREPSYQELDPRGRVPDMHPANTEWTPSYELARRFHLPTLEMSTFDGDVGKYRCFMRAFHANIVSRVINEEEKLHYLHQFTIGRPKEIVATCLHLPPERGFAEAMSLLDHRYGRPVQVAAGLIDKLLQYSNLKTDDVEGLETFAIHLRGSLNALATLPCGTGSIDVKTIRLLLEKLPQFMRDKWRIRVDDIEQSDQRQAEFSDFVQFIEREARIASNPSYGRHVTAHNETKHMFKERKAEQGFNTKGKLLMSNTSTNHLSVSCLLCEQNHEVSECSQLERKRRDEKIAFVFSNRLCFGCLRPNHIVKYCKEKKICNKCKGLHPTALHIDQQQEPVVPTVTSGHLSSGGGANLQVVPVRVTLFGATALTSAFLDSGSTHSFISKQLLGRLGAHPSEKTSITLSTINADQIFETCVVPHVVIEDFEYNNRLELPPLFALNTIPISSDDAPKPDDLYKWPYLIEGGVHFEKGVEGEVGLLLGNNVAAAAEPLAVIPSQDGGPYAVRTRYGWVLGGAKKANKGHFEVHKIHAILSEDLYGNRAEYKMGLSAEDLRWHSIVESSCKFRDGRYEIALPFRNASPELPNNKVTACKRLEQLKRKFQKYQAFATEYTRQVEKLLDKGYAEKAPEYQHDRIGRTWYLPHHGVESPMKKDKIRVVFDCACQFEGTSLNEELLQGPDFANSLSDVLLRFRKDSFAFMADLEGMFLQVKVPENQRDFLRFLWWPNGNISLSPKEYRMTVHVFGATSSPSCANFALRRVATDFGALYDQEVAETILNNFYVDDCLVTKCQEEDIIRLASNVKQICARGGFNLTKFVSNSLLLMRTISNDDLSPKIQNLDLASDSLPTDRALGVSWNVQTDMLGYNVEIEKFVQKPLTRRGMLSATAAFYDPLGLVAPFIMKARMLLQELTRLRLGWDETVPDEHTKQWKIWISDLGLIDRYNVPRSVMHYGLSHVSSLELHHFSDASERGYGVASYLRVVDRGGSVSCTLLLSRSHLAPIKPLSVPRLELSAATLAVKVNLEIERALKLEISPRIYFWTDSSTVLKYINNEAARFHVFVANRLAVIRDGSSIDQWKWVPSEDNPADLLSRGCDANTLLRQTAWRHGPRFLQESGEQWPQPVGPIGKSYDLEIKLNTTSVNQCDESTNPVQKLAAYYSSWTRLKRGVAWIRRVVAKLVGRGGPNWPRELTVSELAAAERVIIQRVQNIYYPTEIENLRVGQEVRSSSSLVSLDPKYEEGLLRVGGRLRHATDLEYHSRHPLIIPGTGKITELIIQHLHERVGHEGRQHVLAELRKKYWVVRANTAVRKCLRQCISCRRRIRPMETQKAADLPADRVQQGVYPWVSTGVDLFGPFYTKRGRTQVKRYGVIFTCLTMRAVHLEVAESLSADSFICALRRFIARRGSHVRLIRSDNGTNFIGADRELNKELDMLAECESKIFRETVNRGIEWRWNPPGSSHFGGAWERLIRSVRKILGALLREQTFSDETLSTFLCEAESIMNNRPLIPVTSDPRDQVPLSPNHLLQLNYVVMPSSVVTDNDLVCRKSWKRASFLAEQFWRRWRTEYLPLLQQRAGRWTRSQANLRQGDVVLVVDSSVPRGVWPLGLIEEVKISSDSRVRSVKVRCRGTTLWRPIHKLVKLAEM